MSFEDMISSFRRKIGLDDLPPSRSREGVVLDWHRVPAAVAAYTAKLRAGEPEFYLFAPGIAQMQWTWRDEEGILTLEVAVSSKGVDAAREHLVYLLRMWSFEPPFERVPGGMGDLTLHSRRSPPHSIWWLYRNVCLKLDGEGTGIPLEAMADVIQRLMEQNVADELAAHVPQPKGVDLSTREISVGEAMSVDVHLGANLPASVQSEIWIPHHEDLDIRNVTNTHAEFVGKRPGRAFIDVKIADSRTLLSPPLEVFVDVVDKPTSANQ